MLIVASSEGGEGRHGKGVRPFASFSSGVQELRVLIVEDEWLISLDMEETVEKAGFEVCGIAANADEAVRMAEMHRPDITMMDVQLSGERDGVDAAIELYRRFGLRCLFVTAHSDGSVRERASAAMPLGWLAKPFSEGQLVEALTVALGASEK